MNQPTPLSILISVFNAEKTLDKCFESIAKQHFQNFVIVCINDHSTDTSPQLITKWQQVFGEKFTLIENTTNLGLTRSLNLGLQHIDTPYTARIDSDDWWHPSKLQKQMTFLESHLEYGLIGSHYQNVFGEKTKDIHTPETDQEIKKLIFGYNPFGHSAVVFATKLVKAAGGYDESIYYGQDYELWLRLLPQTEFYNLPEILCYRTGDSGISKERQNEQIIQYMKTQWKYVRRYKYPLSTYLNFIRPLLVLLSPQWLKNIKYRLSL